MAIEDLDEFNFGIEGECEKIVGAVDFLHKYLTFHVFDGVVKGTPVDRGRARGNWQISVGDPLDSEAAWSPSFSTAVGKAQIDAAPAFSNLWITNNVPYILVLEFGLFEPPNPGPSKDPRRGRRVLVVDGFSTQAPGPIGFVQRTIDEAAKWWEENAQAIVEQWPGRLANA